MDEDILEAVSQHDEAYEGEMLDEDEPFDIERPTTADDGESGVRKVENVHSYSPVECNRYVCKQYKFS